MDHQGPDLAGLVMLVGAGVWFCSFIAGGLIGGERGSPFGGMCLGLFLGPFGVIAAGFLDARGYCRRCHGRLNGRPEVCPHCHLGLPTPPPPVAIPVDPRVAELQTLVYRVIQENERLRAELAKQRLEL